MSSPGSEPTAKGDVLHAVIPIDADKVDVMRLVLPIDVDGEDVIMSVPSAHLPAVQSMLRRIGLVPPNATAKNSGNFTKHGADTIVSQFASPAAAERHKLLLPYGLAIISELQALSQGHDPAEEARTLPE